MLKRYISCYENQYIIIGGNIGNNVAHIYMKKYLPYHIIFVLLWLPNYQAMAQSTVYVGLTYEIGADARADRQVYDVKTETFDNQFSVKYPFGSKPGYLAGIGNNSFSIEYRVSESEVKPASGVTSFFHNNVVLTGAFPRWRAQTKSRNWCRQCPFGSKGR